LPATCSGGLGLIVTRDQASGVSNSTLLTGDRPFTAVAMFAVEGVRPDGLEHLDTAFSPTMSKPSPAALSFLSSTSGSSDSHPWNMHCVRDGRRKMRACKQDRPPVRICKRAHLINAPRELGVVVLEFDSYQ